MTVQDLIDSLAKIKNKNKQVAACIDEVDTAETIIVDVVEEGDGSVCWLKIPETSSIHSYGMEGSRD